MYSYYLFGLRIDSAIALSHTPVWASLNAKREGPQTDAFKQPVITIRRNTHNIRQGNKHLPLKHGTCFEVQEDKVLILIPEVASFHLSPGEILVTPAEHSDDAAVELFTRNLALGITLWWESALVLHAAAIHHRGQTYLILGDSSTGKSHLSAQADLEGSQVLSDELCRIHFEAGNMFVEAGFPAIQVWQSTLETLQLKVCHDKAVRKGLQKFYFPLQQYDSRKRQVDKIILLDSDNSTTQVQRLHGPNAINGILANTYRKSYLKAMNMAQKAFEHSCQASVCAPTFLINRQSLNLDMLESIQ